MLKDRRSRSGLTNQSETQRKNGAGAHNWGSYEQEGELEAAATRDAAEEQDVVFDMEGDNANENTELKVGPLGRVPKATDGEALEGQDKGVDRDVIATSPSESMSSIDSAVGGKGRRMSNVSDEERDRARLYREGVKAKGGKSGCSVVQGSIGLMWISGGSRSYCQDFVWDRSVASLGWIRRYQSHSDQECFCRECHSYQKTNMMIKVDFTR